VENSRRTELKIPFYVVILIYFSVERDRSKCHRQQQFLSKMTDLLWCYLPPCVGKYIFATLTLARMQWLFSMQCANLRLAVCKESNLACRRKLANARGENFGGCLLAKSCLWHSHHAPGHPHTLRYWKNPSSHRN